MINCYSLLVETTGQSTSVRCYTACPPSASLAEDTGGQCGGRPAVAGQQQGQQPGRVVMVEIGLGALAGAGLGSANQFEVRLREECCVGGQGGAGRLVQHGRAQDGGGGEHHVVQDDKLGAQRALHTTAGLVEITGLTVNTGFNI